MRRWLPAPWLSLALAALWLVLNDAFDPAHLLFALLLGVAVPWLARPLRPTPVRLSKPRAALRLIGRVGLDVLAWNWRVLRGTLAATPPEGGFVVVPLELRDPSGLAALAAIMCVIPGTIWSELSLDRSALLVHMFELADADAEIVLIKQRYEQPLREIFE